MTMTHHVLNYANRPTMHMLLYVNNFNKHYNARNCNDGACRILTARHLPMMLKSFKPLNASVQRHQMCCLHSMQSLCDEHMNTRYTNNANTHAYKLRHAVENTNY